MSGAEPVAARREFFRRTLAAGASVALLGAIAPPSFTAQEPDTPRLSGEGENGTLGDPGAVGRPRAPTRSVDNDGTIKSVELRLACTCGCTLDIYTCRTTDFSCTYSPALHREIVALHDSGASAQQIIDAFVDKYGEKALMAPKPRGFNLAGYLVPSALISLAGGALIWIVTRRKRVNADERPAGAGTSVSGGPAASTRELDRLQQELARVDD